MLNTFLSKLLSPLEVYQRTSQQQVFRCFKNFNSENKNCLIRQVSGINPERVNHIFFELQIRENSSIDTNNDKITAAPYLSLLKNQKSYMNWRNAYKLGNQIIRMGRVAVLTVAGGQGTRLGFIGPKGTFSATPIKKKSLFQIFAEKIKKAQMYYKKQIPWFIMTSSVNESDIRKFFLSNYFFGLFKSNIHFFQQGSLPTLDFNGKIMLSDLGKIIISPDGHGGTFKALVESGAINKMSCCGIDTVSYFQVDNPLVQVIDPVFIGFHHLYKSEMSSRMIPKKDVNERVGIFVKKNNKISLIEYSDLPKQLAVKKNKMNELKFIAGNPAVHILDRNFIKKLGDIRSSIELPYHRIHRIISAIDRYHNSSESIEPNGIKLEQFIFDALFRASNPVIIESNRKFEFSPIKNANGMDSPKTCYSDQVDLYHNWMNYAEDISKIKKTIIEISPSFAANRLEFTSKWNSLTHKPFGFKRLYVG